MPAVARKDKRDSVKSPHGVGPDCIGATTYKTDEGSDNVFVNGYGVVREGDKMEEHPKPGCVNHAPTLKSFSSKVYVNGKRLGRFGDAYIEAGNHVISSGSENVSDGSPQTSAGK